MLYSRCLRLLSESYFRSVHFWFVKPWELTKTLKHIYYITFRSLRKLTSTSRINNTADIHCLFLKCNVDDVSCHEDRKLLMNKSSVKDVGWVQVFEGCHFLKRNLSQKHFTRYPLFRVTPSTSQEHLSLNWYMVFVREMGSTNLNYRLNDLRVSSRENDSSNRYERLSEHIWSK